MPCIQYNPTPPGSSYISQVCGHASDFSSEMMNLSCTKCNLELSSTDITASATTSLPSFSTFIEGYSGSYELKPSCLYQLQATGQRPLIKMEYGHPATYRSSSLQETEDPQPSTSSYFKSSPPSSPTSSGYSTHKSAHWDDKHALPASHPCMTHANLMEPSHKSASSHFPIFCLKTSPLHTSVSSPPGQGCCESTHNAPLGLHGDSSQISLESLSFNLPMTKVSNLVGSPADPTINVLGECSSLTALSRSSSSGEGSCAVCGDNAACQHYGVRTCEGCKGFFKRTVQKNAKYVCLANKSCPVDKRRRNRCQYCRFQKCLSVGMVKEVVRTDSLKGRRGRLPSKPKSPSHQEPSTSTMVSPVNLLEALVQAAAYTTPNDLDYSSFSADTSQVSSSTDAECIQQFYNLLTISAEMSKKWAEKIPGFLELPSDDQVLLIEMAFLELFVFRLSIRSNISADEFVFCNGLVLHRLQCLRGFGEWLESIRTFSLHLQSLNLDISILATLSALCLITERHGLTEPKKVNELHNKISSCLKDYLALNIQNKKTSQQVDTATALRVLTDLRTLCTLGLQRIFYLKLEDLVPTPPLIDRLFFDTLPF